MSEKRIRIANGDILIRTEEGIYFLSVSGTSLPILIDEEEGEKLLFDRVEQQQSEIDGLQAFYDYFGELYGTGLEVANWHQNGELEPFDNFFDSAEQEMN